MLRRLLYELLYVFTRPRWDTGITPPEVVEMFASGAVPPGPTLDIGCGTGTNVIYMARQGRHVVGIDFSSKAISTARKKVKEAGVEESVRLLLGDATQLPALAPPLFALALDMGCFHGLSEDGQRRYVKGLAPQMQPGGWVMLYTRDPSSSGGRMFGVTPERVRAIFAPWFEIERLERDDEGGGSTWFWMRRREAAPEPG